jgi:hypothetical protein
MKLNMGHKQPELYQTTLIKKAAIRRANATDRKNTNFVFIRGFKVYTQREVYRLILF